MPPQRVLWFANEDSPAMDSRHGIEHPDLEITRVTDLAETVAEVRSGAVDCVLVSAESRVDREIILEALFCLLYTS